MAKEQTHLQMEIATQVNTRMESLKALVFTLGQMVTTTRVSLRKVLKKAKANGRNT